MSDTGRVSDINIITPPKNPLSRVELKNPSFAKGGQGGFLHDDKHRQGVMYQRLNCGRKTDTSVDFPYWLKIFSLPLYNFTIFWTIARPKPEPCCS
ncbi:MAG: hypothetical protein QG635_1656 [Bacteroidota bacterium]|nr:hypothetical protein [Bacteroidota bacterium]